MPFIVLFLARKLAVTIAMGPFSEMVEVLVRAKGDLGNSVNPPLPSPLKTEMVLSPWLATAKSGLPSPLKSATTMELGFLPTGYGEPVASRNVPSPFPSRTVTLLDVELAMTRSAVGVATPEVLVTVFPKVPTAMAEGAVSVFPRAMGELVAAA